jgi:hypothetical protein
MIPSERRESSSPPPPSVTPHPRPTRSVVGAASVQTPLGWETFVILYHETEIGQLTLFLTPEEATALREDLAFVIPRTVSDGNGRG